jgi:hypothetical protein
VEVELQEFSGMPEYTTLPAGEVYGCLGIVTASIPSENIDSTEIEFKIQKSWMRRENVGENTIQLLRWTENSWENLETEFLYADAEYSHYRAWMEGLSLFAAVGQRIVPPSPPPEIPPERPVVTAWPPLLLLALGVSFALNGLFMAVVVYPRLALWRRERVLKQLKRAVIERKPRRIGEPLAIPPEEVRPEAEVTTLKRLKQLVLRKKRKSG